MTHLKKLVVKNIGQLVSCDEQNTIVTDAELHCENGIITYAGPASAAPAAAVSIATIDAQGLVLIPGLVDCHTHVVFAGDRSKEFARKCTGVSYLEIAKEGGGIQKTVKATRAATAEALYDSAAKRVQSAISFGVTTLESKSGYGLNWETEQKILEVNAKLDASLPIDIISTFLGAHIPAPEYKSDPETYVSLVIDQMLPAVKQNDLAEFCDIFVEEGAFTKDQALRIATAAKSHGLKIKLHIDQFSDGGGGTLAANLGAVSADHLDFTSDQSIKDMVQSNVVGVNLPGAVLFLGQDCYADLKHFISLGLKVAIATDCNPGSSFTQNLPLMGTLACTYGKLSPLEALKAMTVNAALAIDRSDRGVLAKGFLADAVLLNISDYNQFFYEFGINHTRSVIKNGQLIL
jgi:imidazolonepropionase